MADGLPKTITVEIHVDEQTDDDSAERDDDGDGAEVEDADPDTALEDRLDALSPLWLRLTDDSGANTYVPVDGAEIGRNDGSHAYTAVGGGTHVRLNSLRDFHSFKWHFNDFDAVTAADVADVVEVDLTDDD